MYSHPLYTQSLQWTLEMVDRSESCHKTVTIMHLLHVYTQACTCSRINWERSLTCYSKIYGPYFSRFH